MATLLLKKNQWLRSLSLLAAVVLVIGVKSSTPAAGADVATSVKFTILNTCAASYGGANFLLKISGQTIATISGGADCTCGPALRTYSTSDPAVLALVGAPTCTDIALTMSGSALMAWSRVEIARSVSGTETFCLQDQNGGNCTVTDLCSAGYAQYTNATFSAGPPDSDGDGINNCVDPDVDGDGVLNTTDNCPFIANTAQTDTDDNGTGDACQPILVAVPWLGSEALPHQVYSGGSVTLQAVASLPGDGSPVTLASGTWDPGDGSGAQTISISNSLVLELAHTYTGSAGQPFTATVRVVDTSGSAYTDTFKVVIAPNTRETKVNMAIDKGLWRLHKRMNRTTSDGQPSAYWTGWSPYIQVATASTVQAFEINNHREAGDPSRDPYVNDARMGLRYILSSQHGTLQRMDVPVQNGNNPDANGNGYGLVVSPTDHSSYINGQIIDAIVASGTPNKTADVGQATYVLGRTYKNIVQDMLDGYSYGIADNTGGWYYTYQSTTGSNDTSASHWWAIGVLASRAWGLDAPAWVKNIQKTIGIPLMQAYPGDCHFGYTNNTSSIWDSGTNVTAAGLILMNADGFAKTDPRFTCAEGYLASLFNSSLGNFYTMYQTTKAMRTATDATGATSPITMLNGTIDWYARYADYMIDRQNTLGTGQMDGLSGSAGQYIIDDMGTSWAVIMLSPSLFQLPPTASCTANPATIGTHGGVVSFDASASFHPDPTATITSYTWNFGDASTGSGETTSHTYAQPPSFPTTRNATVTVADSNGNTSTASCPVEIVNTNVPPAVNAGGPYTFCMGTPVLLAATATDEDGTIASTGWDLTVPVNFSSLDATGLSVNATAAFTALGAGTYDIGFIATDSDGATNSAFGTVTMLAANNPACNQPPTAVNDSASTFSGTPVTIAVLANDTDPDSNTLTVSATGAPSHGAVVINSNGTITYTPVTGWASTDTFTYTIDDGHGMTSTATVTVTMTRRTATVTAGSGTKVYGAADPILTATSTGFQVGDGINVAYTGRAAGENVGNYATHAKATGALLANYTVTYTDGSLTITKAASTTVVSCTPSVTYTGTAFEVCAANVTGAGGLNAAVTPVTYTNNINVGTAAATATYVGDGNHTASTGNATFAITKAATATVVTCTPSVTYTGTAFEVCAANVTGAGGLNEPVTPVGYTNNVNVGTAAATATYVGDDNHTASTGNATFAITKAGTATVVTCAPSVTYNGAAQEVCAANVTGAGGLNEAVTPVAYTNNVNVGTAAATATYVGDDNHSASTGNATFAITKASTATVVSCTPSVTYTGTAFEVCTANVTGAGGLNEAVTPVTYTNNINVGTAAATATYVGDDNHTASTGDATFAITKAATATVVTCAPSVTYTGTAFEVCTAAVTGAGGLNEAVTPVTYTNNINVGTAAATATYVGDDNHTASTGNATFAITKAATATVVTCTPSVTYTGTAFEVCAANVTGAGGLNEPVTPVTYTNNVNVGTAAATATYVGDDNHTASTGDATFAITKASTATVVTCTPSVTYTGTAFEVCTAAVTGAGGLNEPVTPVGYTNNVNVGTAAATATYVGDDNHTASTGNATFAITKAGTVTVVTCTPSVTYTGTAFEVCTAAVTGAGGLNEPVTPVSYTNNVNVGTAAATATYVGDDNHTASTGDATFAITKAATATVVTCAPSVTYTGTAFEVCTAAVTGAGGLNEAVTPVAYTNNVNVGTAAATATYVGDDNHTASTGNATFAITKAAAIVTAGSGTKIYGTLDPTLTPASLGFVTDITVTETPRDAGETVGAYATHATASGDTLSNYDVTYLDGSLVITKANLLVTAADKTRPYLNPNPVLTGTVTGVVTGDTITASYSTTAVLASLPGNYPITPALADLGNRLGNYSVTITNGTLTITNASPVCTAAKASPSSLWPPNHKWVEIKILNVTDPDGNPVTIKITSIFQDEPTNTKGDGETDIDGKGVGTSSAWVRAERMGDRSGENHGRDKGHYDGDKCDHDRRKNGHKNGDRCEHERDKDDGNGRVYHIRFTATDGLLSCNGDVTVGVPHDQGQHNAAIDDGPLYDSTKDTTPSGHRKGDGCKDDDHEYGRPDHRDGDKCDHELGKNGHKKNDGCDHERRDRR